MIEIRVRSWLALLVGVVEFVFDGSADPGRDGAVFGLGSLADLF
jgi:hypothetical protein